MMLSITRKKLAAIAAAGATCLALAGCDIKVGGGAKPAPKASATAVAASAPANHETPGATPATDGTGATATLAPNPALTPATNPAAVATGNASDVLDMDTPDTKAPNPCTVMTPSDVQNVLHVTTVIPTGADHPYATKRFGGWVRTCGYDHAPGTNKIQLVTLNIVNCPDAAAAMQGYNGVVQSESHKGYQELSATVPGATTAEIIYVQEDKVGEINFVAGARHGWIVVTGIPYPGGDYRSALQQLAAAAVGGLNRAR